MSPGVERATPQGARDHRSRPLDGEDTVQRDARQIGPGSLRGPVRSLEESGTKLVHAASVHGGRGDSRGVGVGRPLEEIVYVGLDQLEPLGLHQVRLGVRHHQAWHPQKTHDPEVLAGLRHDPFVGGHHEEDHVHAGGAGQHGTHEGLVPRHVHHPEAEPVVRAGEFRESKLDGDAAGLFLLQPVRIHAGERPDEGRLAVVDVPGRPEYEAMLGHAGVSASAGSRSPRNVSVLSGLDTTWCTMKSETRARCLRG